MVWPIRRDTLSNTRRATASTALPAGNGEMRRIVCRVGHAGAWAWAALASATARRSAEAPSTDRCCILDFLPENRAPEKPHVWHRVHGSCVVHRRHVNGANERKFKCKMKEPALGGGTGSKVARARAYVVLAVSSDLAVLSSFLYRLCRGRCRLAARATTGIDPVLRRQHDDFGADVDATVEVHDVLVDEADATRRHVVADGFRRVRAVDAIDRVAEIHGARAQRIARATGHEARQVGLARDHFRGRRPIRPLGLARHRLGARPGEAVAADADAIAERLAVAEHVVEVGVRRIDDHRARGLAARIVDDLAAEAVALLSAIVRIARIGIL